MKKALKHTGIVTGVLLGLMVLYLTGGFLLSDLGLEYRFWVSGIGKTLCILAFPFWVVGAGVRLLWLRFREHSVGKWLVRLAGVAAALLCFIWFWLGLMIMVFSGEQEHRLGGGLLSVVKENFPKATEYVVYECEGPFFRRKTALTVERTAEYLTDKYKRDFYPVNEDGEVLYVDAERESIRVAVRYRDGELQDGYPQALADYCLAEGYQTLGLEWDSRVLETRQGEEHFCLVLDEEKNITAFGADVYRLMQYALEQEPLLEKQEVYIYLTVSKYSGHWGCEGFGSSRSWESLSTRQYKSDEAKVIQAVRWFADSMRIEAHLEGLEAEGMEMQSDVKETAITGAKTATIAVARKIAQESRPSPTPEPTEREMVEGEYPEQCRAAEAIWEAALKDAGYGYEPGANAKGNLVIWLGKLPADNLQSDSSESDYYLTYDRESKNGNCYLFVLSEVPEGYGLNDAYLREFYACEKETLKVVAGNKTSWAQTGCAEYRELTGE